MDKRSIKVFIITEIYQAKNRGSRHFGQSIASCLISRFAQKSIFIIKKREREVVGLNDLNTVYNNTIYTVSLFN